PMSRRGSAEARGPVSTRGGRLSWRGGPVSTRGGRLSWRGGPVSTRGGRLSWRGGPVSTRGGRLSWRGRPGSTRRGIGTLAVALATIPANVYALRLAQQDAAPVTANSNFINRDESAALTYLRTAPVK